MSSKSRLYNLWGLKEDSDNVQQWEEGELVTYFYRKNSIDRNSEIYNSGIGIVIDGDARLVSVPVLTEEGDVKYFLHHNLLPFRTPTDEQIPTERSGEAPRDHSGARSV